VNISYSMCSTELLLKNEKHGDKEVLHETSILRLNATSSPPATNFYEEEIRTGQERQYAGSLRNLPNCAETTVEFTKKTKEYTLAGSSCGLLGMIGRKFGSMLAAAVRVRAP
jgi:hypothetical protein